MVADGILEGLQAKTGREDNVASLRATTQKEISLAIDLRNHGNLITSITASNNIRDKARMGSLGLPNSGAWLNVVPSPTLGLHLQSLEFITAVKYRLGVNVFLQRGNVQLAQYSQIQPETMRSRVCGEERELPDTTLSETCYLTLVYRLPWDQPERIELSSQVQREDLQIFYCQAGQVEKIWLWTSRW